MTRVLVIDDDHSAGAAIHMMLTCQGSDTVSLEPGLEPGGFAERRTPQAELA